MAPALQSGHHVLRGAWDTSCSMMSCFEGMAGDGRSRGRTDSSVSKPICGFSIFHDLRRASPDGMPSVAHGGRGVDGCSASISSPIFLTPARPSIWSDCGLTDSSVAWAKARPASQKGCSLFCLGPHTKGQGQTNFPLCAAASRPQILCFGCMTHPGQRRRGSLWR